jgi:hypothetical protein
MGFVFKNLIYFGARGLKLRASITHRTSAVIWNIRVTARAWTEPLDDEACDRPEDERPFADAHPIEPAEKSSNATTITTKPLRNMRNPSLSFSYDERSARRRHPFREPWRSGDAPWRVERRSCSGDLLFRSRDDRRLTVLELQRRRVTRCREDGCVVASLIRGVVLLLHCDRRPIFERSCELFRRVSVDR